MPCHALPPGQLRSPPGCHTPRDPGRHRCRLIGARTHPLIDTKQGSRWSSNAPPPSRSFEALGSRLLVLRGQPVSDRFALSSLRSVIASPCDCFARDCLPHTRIVCPG